MQNLLSTAQAKESKKPDQSGPELKRQRRLCGTTLFTTGEDNKIEKVVC
jgi:hypothetical protein